MATRSGVLAVGRFVVYIHDDSAIQEVAARTAARELAAFGLEVVALSVRDAQAEPMLKKLLRERGDDLFFFYSSNLWALNIRRGDLLLHALTGIPLVILMQDHPIYFLHQLSPALNGAIFFVPGFDSADFVTKHYGLKVQTVVNAGLLPSADDRPNEPDAAHFLRRKNALLCPMNLSVFGENIDDTWRTIKALPGDRRNRALRLIDAALTDCELPLHMISERLSAAGDPEIALEDLRWVLNFVKLWRRTRLVEMLVDLPILISSAYVPAEMERRYPKKFTTLTRPQTLALYPEYRFVVNSNPLFTHCLHDRVTEAVANNCVLITDPSPILTRYFSDDRDVIFVDYAQTNLAERITGLLEDPDRAFELTARAYEVRARQSISSDAYGELVRTVERARELSKNHA